jgi:hypothetical protein
MIEAQIDYILGALPVLADRGTLEVSAEAQAAYVAELDRRAASTVWLNGGCASWYVDERSQRLTLLWPDLAYRFREALQHFDPAPYRDSSTQSASAEVMYER